MRIKQFALLISATLILVLSAGSCNGVNAAADQVNREIVLKNDNTNEERNRLLTEDIKYFQKELPRRHKNLFAKLNKEEFNRRTDQLIDRVDELNNYQVFVELNKIVASLGDAHTAINYWDGYSYPLRFWVSDGNIYIVNADKGLEEMMYSRVLKIDDVDIETVVEQLTTLISHENESWVLAQLPDYLPAPVFLYGLGLLKNETEAVFTVEKDGKVQDVTVTALEYGEEAQFINTETDDVLLGLYDTYYEYEYLPGDKTLYFEYNVCADMEEKKFADFNQEMYDVIEENEVEKIIVDLRNNSGGNSEILNPFTQRLKSYVSGNSDVKVYILNGRNTFSSGMFAIFRIKEAVPEAICIGEPTGGALDCYGDVRTFNLPNSQIPVGYSTKHFQFTMGIEYKNVGLATFLPDITLQPTIEDDKNGNDVVLKYALEE